MPVAGAGVIALERVLGHELGVAVGGTLFLLGIALLGWVVLRARRRSLHERHALPIAMYALAIVAILVGGTGYQYGDTDFLEYSERLYLNLARALRSSSSSGAASSGHVPAELRESDMRPLRRASVPSSSSSAHGHAFASSGGLHTVEEQAAAGTTESGHGAADGERDAVTCSGRLLLSESIIIQDHF